MTSISRQYLSDRVYDHLVQQLNLKRYQIGTRINTREISEELAVSRTTVTKALERLSQAGWVAGGEDGRLVVASYPPLKEVRSRAPFGFVNQTDSTYELLLEHILKGEEKPGAIIKERAVAKSLGVNPATVRRAAEWLRNDGLLVRLPRRGWQVTSLDARDIRDVYQIRLLLEPVAFSAAVRRISEDSIERLREDSRRLISLGEEASVYDRRTADYNFHRTVCEASGNRVLTQTLEPLIRKVLLITTVGFRYGRSTRSFEEHEEILRALRDRDAARTVRTLKDHLRTAMKFNAEVWERR